MKNKVIQTMLALTITTALLAGNAASVMAADTVKTEKDETVYVKTDATGAKKTVTVSDLISNIASASSIEDISSLMGIQNVKGDEAYSQNGNKVIWSNDGANEICYQGTTDQEIPVGVHLTYELDGKTIQPEDLKGKSGHLKITVSYSNTTKGKSYVPFLMATGIVLDGDKYSNIQVENGKKISDGSRSLVVGYGIPGLGDYLNVKKNDLLKEMDFSDSFSMEADVTDFEKVTCMSMATTEFFNDLETDKMDSLDDLKESMNDLQKGADQLTDGSGELKKGIDTLLNSSGDLTSGVDQLSDGGKQLADGTDSLADGAKQLKDGTAALKDGTKQLSDGAGSLVDGTKQLKDGAKSAKSGAGQLDAGLAELQAGVSSMKDDTAAGIQRLYLGAGSLVDGIATAKTGADQINGGLVEAKKGSESLSAGLGQAKQGAAGIQQLAAGIAASIPSKATAENVEVQAEAVVDNSDIRSAIEETLRGAGVDEAAIAAAVACAEDKTVTVTTTTSVEVPVDTTVLSGYSQQLTATADAVSSGLADLNTGAATLDGALGQLKTGAGELSSALASDGQLSTGASALQTGIGTLGTSLNQGTESLIGGVKQLKAGSSELSTGLGTLHTGISQAEEGAVQLYQGIMTADAGAAQLYTGSTALADGSSQLQTGAKTLSDGLGELQTGSGKLIDGVKQLDDGADELDKGMNKLNEEGIKKVTDIFNGDAEDLLKQVQTMIDNAKDYQTFTGISDHMTGKVKFIFVAE